jgi:hypothetical protein
MGSLVENSRAVMKGNADCDLDLKEEMCVLEPSPCRIGAPVTTKQCRSYTEVLCSAPASSVPVVRRRPAAEFHAGEARYSSSPSQPLLSSVVLPSRPFGGYGLLLLGSQPKYLKII